MQLVRLESNLRAFPAPEIAEIKEFNDLIRRDRGSPGDSQGRKKQRATRELAYLFHKHSFESPYAQYEPTLREEKVRADLFPEDWNWQPDEIFLAAEAKYLELTKTSLIRLLDASEVAIARLTDYFNSIRFTLKEDDPEGMIVDTAKDVISNLANLAKVVTSHQQLREEVEKDQLSSRRLRGGVSTTKYNE